MEPSSQPQPEQTSQTQATYTPPTNATPMQTGEPVTPVTPLPPTKNKKPLLIVLTMVLLAAIGVALWFFVFNKEEAAAPANTSEKSEQHMDDGHSHGDENLSQTVAAIFEDLQTAYPEVDTATLYTADENIGITLKDETINQFVVVMSEDNNSGILSSSEYLEDGDNLPLYSSLLAAFKEDGFTEKIVESFGDVVYSDDIETFLEKDGHLCQLTTLSFSGVTFACVEESEFEAEATSVAPFYTAYENGVVKFEGGSDSYVITIDEETQTTSRFKDYETVNGAIGSFSGANIIFWRKNGGDWNYGFAYQAPLDCTEYATEDLQKAYVDNDCNDDANEEVTVGDYYSLIP